MARNHRGSGGRLGSMGGFDAAFYTRHLPHLQTRLWRMGIDGADVDDLVQQTFVIAHDHWDQRPRGRRKQRSWLEGIAWRLAMNLRRCHELRYETLGLEALDAFVGQEHDLEALLDARRLSATVGDIVAVDCDMLVAYYVDDVPLTKIAAQYGMPRSTAWSRIQRLRHALAE